MKSWILCMLLLILPDPVKINKINKTKAEAKKAYESGDYKTAAAKYKYLIDSLGVHEDEAKLNLANAYFNLQDSSTVNAYQQLTQSSNREVRSKAEQQLGVLKNKAGQAEEALQHFKNALKANPQNQDARYNYEMLKKKLEEEKKKQQQQNQNQDQKNDQQENQDQQNKDKKEQEKKDQQQKEQEKKDQQQKDQQNKDKKDQQQKEQEKKDQQQQKEKQEQEQKDAKDEQEKKDQQPSPSEKLKQMNMSEEKAKMILEAMKNQEVQYLQQNKRKATKPRDKSKPDW